MCCEKIAIISQAVSFLISRPAQIRALASAARQDIIDAVVAIGPASAPEIALALGRRPDALYYHLRVLTRVGLLRTEGVASGAARAAARYDVPGRPMSIRYDLSDRASALALTNVTASMLRSAGRGFARATTRRSTRVGGPQRELWAARTRGWLTRDQLEEVNRIMSRLIQLLSSGTPPEDACAYEVTFVLSPVPSP